jgi:hypothetical protein
MKGHLYPFRSNNTHFGDGIRKMKKRYAAAYRVSSSQSGWDSSSCMAALCLNEPKAVAAMGGAPKGYDAATYGRDERPFAHTLKAAAPEIILLGPSSGGDASNGQSVANRKFDRYSVSRLSFRLLRK